MQGNWDISTELTMTSQPHNVPMSCRRIADLLQIRCRCVLPHSATTHTLGRAPILSPQAQAEHGATVRGNSGGGTVTVRLQLAQESFAARLAEAN